ncbi:hypothetical protein [Mesoflavibacter sp. CH_XMU1422-2]|uniref:hypothetical protein n=1 Tax=Mesoflavibacter sp. CH_XMU1422-2 TaxID=3107770 RepID=UPI00300A2104
MSYKLIIERKNELNNRNRAFAIYINGEYYEDIGSDENEKTLFFDTKLIEIKFKIDWCYSNKMTISFNDSKVKKISVSSSISNLLWHFIVSGITFSVLFYFIFNRMIFVYLPLVIIAIPVYKITFGRNNYLKIKEK